MSKQVAIPPPGFDDLSIDEQIEYVQSLWERITADPSKVPVPDWHRKILNDRLKAYREEPEGGATWDQVREEIERKLSGLRVTSYPFPIRLLHLNNISFKIVSYGGK